MANNTALFGIPSDDLEETRKRVEELFAVSLRGVDSDSWGEYYKTPGYGDNTISVFQNFNPSERHWNAPEHMELPLLLSIVDAPEMDRFRELLMKYKTLGAVFIEMHDFEKERQNNK